ncbi:hypothetical protein Scep_022318 [Stephania cephalantha]|uniref:Uncharacterized protein n=1 Tax=Stephania cephalantha TaxID=152367 RepID=A0AAP0FH35_9MAGN
MVLTNRLLSSSSLQTHFVTPTRQDPRSCTVAEEPPPPPSSSSSPPSPLSPSSATASRRAQGRLPDRPRGAPPPSPLFVAAASPFSRSAAAASSFSRSAAPCDAGIRQAEAPCAAVTGRLCVHQPPLLGPRAATARTLRRCCSDPLRRCSRAVVARRRG